MKKVFCKNCKYYIDNVCYYALVDVEDKKLRIVKLENKNNDCKYYERKWWKFWIK